MNASPLPRHLRAAGTAFAMLVGVLMVLALLSVAWIGIRGAIAADHLRSAQASASAIIANITEPAAVTGAIGEVADDAATARALTSDPVWRLGEMTPWIGPQLRAVSTVAAAADDVAVKALGPLAEAASTLSPESFRPTGGRIDPTVFIALQESSAIAAETMKSASDSLAGISTEALVGPLRAAVDEVTVAFASAESGAEALAKASVLLPAMLGAEGARNNLVLFQNNAEWRSLGGINGAMVLIGTDGGAMQLAMTDAGSSFAESEASVLPLAEELTTIYGQRPGKWMQNVTQVPDFAVAGALAREMWARKHGVAVDGVIATDPVALSYMLRATGPVVLPSGDTLTAENAVALLLNDVYLRYEETSEQDAFFQNATSAVFAALTSGAADPAKLLEALTLAGDERRLLLWSAHPDEQELIAETTLAGGLPVTDETTTSFGVYLNDGTGSKMDYYQQVDTSVAWESCVADPAGTVEGLAALSVTITSNAPVEAANLPEYVTAAGWYGVPAGSIRTIGYIYVPEDFALLETALSNGAGFGGGIHEGRRVLIFDVVLAPGESVTASVSAHSTSPTGANLSAHVTPTINATVTTPISACL